MIAMLSGANVTVLLPVEGNRDRFGNPVETYEPREVPDVLIAEPSTEDMEAARAEGVTLAYTLHFPKSYAGPLEGALVELPEPFGGEYRVVGDPRPYMDANTPGRWDRPVRVEAAHG
jgi:hypothetical protein